MKRHTNRLIAMLLASIWALPCWGDSMSGSSLGPSGVTPGSYLNANITVNAKGVITVAANGSSGGSPPQPSYPHAGADTTGVALGLNAGDVQTSNNAHNTSMGNGTLHAAITGSDNAAFGYHALTSLNTGTGNSGFGSYALYSVTSGIDNCGVGEFALYSMTTGRYNTGVGAVVGNNCTGSYNTFIGAMIGNAHAAGGSNNILIGGAQEDTPADNTSNYLNIGNAIYGTGIEGGTVKIGINQAAPGYTLDVNGTLGSAVHYSTAAVTTVNGSSSGNVKWSKEILRPAT